MKMLHVSKGPFALGDNDVFFFCRHVQTVTLMTMQAISEEMVTTSKICVVFAKCGIMNEMSVSMDPPVRPCGRIL